jgi:hypothetical protein
MEGSSIILKLAFPARSTLIDPGFVVTYAASPVSLKSVFKIESALWTIFSPQP